MKISNIPGKASSFLKEVRTEIKKVSWPNRKEAINYTLIVIAISFAVAFYLGGLDAIFKQLLQKFIS